MSDLQCPAKFVFARHGDAVVPAAGGPRQLTQRGEEQARTLARSLEDQRVAALWCSSQMRAQQTASIVGDLLALPVHSDDRLREFMIDERHPVAAADNADAVYRGWLDGDLSGEILGETAQDILGRLSDIVDELADQHRGETVAFITHGGITTLGLVALCRNLRVEITDQRPLDNGQTAEIEVDSSGWTCLRWADAPPDGRAAEPVRPAEPRGRTTP